MDFGVFVSLKTKSKIVGFVRIVVQDSEGLSLVGITLVQGAYK